MSAEGGQLVAAAPAPARDVQHQPAALARLLVDRQAGQLLQRVQNLALPADELGQIAAAVDADDRAVALHVEVDVAVEIEQVQQLLEIVAGDLALGHQALFGVVRAGRHRFVAVL